jgi:RNA polymerase sigma-70 factor, ECF subfamily
VKPDREQNTQPGAHHRPSVPHGHEALAPDIPRLITQARSGDQQALEQLLNQHADMLYAVCFRMCGHAEDARDLAQDVLVKVIEALDSFDGRAKFSTWMTKIAMNHCLTHRRRQKLRGHASLDTLTGGTSESPSEGRGFEQTRELSAHAGVEHTEMQQVLRRAMQELDPDSRALLILRDVRDLDYGQISEVLDIPLGTVKSRLFRARAALRGRIETLWQADTSAMELE